MSDKERMDLGGKGKGKGATDRDTQSTTEERKSATSEDTSVGEMEGKGKEKATEDESSSGLKLGNKLPNGGAEKLLSLNPALKSELAGMDKDKAAETLRKMDIAELMTGLSTSSKNTKDMASYKFWQTQPVVRFDDKGDDRDGPIKEIDVDKVPKEPDHLLEGFEWVTLDLEDENELHELYDLLRNHYVEDTSAMFRFNYSISFLNWALKSPGWRKEWHVGVRASKSRKLVASICGVPADLSVREKPLRVTEINFLCIHKKLRSKRLAPVLIKEITRRCYLSGIYQAIYTGGIVLPTPVSSCRYFHRSLDWLKLYDVGFSGLSAGSTKAREIAKNQLPGHTSTPGLRPMQSKDIEAVRDLLNRYLRRFELTQSFSDEEIDHLLLYKEAPGVEQVVWTYVVEEPATHKVTDFVSFYNIESTVIRSDKHTNIKAAYLYYYASEMAFAENENGLRERLQSLINDALILAKQAHFDVFNALTLHDNPLFLEKLKFGPGDGQLHYYLFNYRAKPVAGGVNDKNMPDERKRGGVAVVMV